jgi:hypothetical protein
MSKKLDVTKVEAALRRAAHKAVHGTREERSGRFIRQDERQPTRGDHRDAPKGPDWVKRKA